MKRLKIVFSAVLLLSLMVATLQPLVSFAHQEGEKTECNAENLGCALTKANVAGTQLQSVAMPKIPPAASPPPVVAKPKVGGAVTYSVETRGNITASLAEFKSQANATLNDGRGWAKLGVSFAEVASGGSFTLVLAEASQMTTFSATGCSTAYSCNVGRYVIINQDRWLGATTSWNNGGGSLRDYRHMVVNHETGHWLGHGHRNCGGPGQAAPVMQQQSIDLQGCAFNPWPLASELYSSRLGI